MGMVEALYGGAVRAATFLGQRCRTRDSGSGSGGVCFGQQLELPAFDLYTPKAGLDEHADQRAGSEAGAVGHEGVVAVKPRKP